MRQTGKKLLILAAVLGLYGCTASHFFVLSTASQPTEYFRKKGKVIGVEEVKVPKYLFKREIAVAKSSSEVVFLSGAAWAEDLHDGLRQRLIRFLQKKFNQPDVYAYPWDVSRQPEIKVKLQISRFIAQNDQIQLDATWELENLRTKKRKAKLFSITTPVAGNDTRSIVKAMDSAFIVLEEDVAHGLRGF